MGFFRSKSAVKSPSPSPSAPSSTASSRSTSPPKSSWLKPLPKLDTQILKQYSEHNVEHRADNAALEHCESICLPSPASSQYSWYDLLGSGYEDEAIPADKTRVEHYRRVEEFVENTRGLHLKYGLGAADGGAPMRSPGGNNVTGIQRLTSEAESVNFNVLYDTESDDDEPAPVVTMNPEGVAEQFQRMMAGEVEECGSMLGQSFLVIPPQAMVGC